MPVIFSTHRLHPAAEAAIGDRALLRVASALDGETLKQEGKTADVVIVRANLPPSLFGRESAMRAAIRHGAGLDMIPVEAATKAGVLVANVPGANARTVAEHVMFASLALSRRFRRVDRDLRDHGWLSGREHAALGTELAGKTMGIIGFGAVGREVAAVAHHGFGLEVLANSRNPRDLPEYVRLAYVDDLVATSDIVVLCCPLTLETTGLMDRRRIFLMRPGAFLINVARGPVVEEAALVDGLSSGHLGGAALDVFSTQPLPADHPFFGFDNVILTPHMAGITEESMRRMGEGAVAEALRVIAGELPVNLCNPEALDLYRRRFPPPAGLADRVSGGGPTPSRKKI